MILCDVNVWLALTLSGHSHHAPAKAWFDSVSPGSVVFCRETQGSLLRLLTTRALFTEFDIEPLTNRQAWDIYAALAADERVAFAGEPANLEAHWTGFALRETASPKLWMDAYLAAFARAANCQLVTIDAAYKQFSGVNLLLLSVEEQEGQ